MPIVTATAVEEEEKKKKRRKIIVLLIKRGRRWMGGCLGEGQSKPLLLVVVVVVVEVEVDLLVPDVARMLPVQSEPPVADLHTSLPPELQLLLDHPVSVMR
jgi:hypothetical protein